MRTSIFSILLAALVGGCGAPDPCAGKSGTCIAAHVDGNAHDLTQARVTLPDGRVTVTQAATGTIKLPAQFAILISDNVPSSPFALQLDGVRGSDVVASDTRLVTLSGTRGSVKFTLDESGGGGAGGDGGGGDMAVTNPPVVTGLDPVTIDELTPLAIDLSATDPLGSNVVLSSNNLPGNAKLTPTGATAKLTWTPSYTDAGVYTVKITATPEDPTRAATYDLVITVKNAADPIVIGGAPALTAVPIGDWDKDGFADLAVCTGDAAGATGKYHLKILYGAAGGLPLDAATQAARTDSFDIAATNLGGSGYSCQGGDYDGDGHADIIFADPLNDYWFATMGAGSSHGQGLFTVMFGGARGVTPPTIFIAGNYNFGTSLGTIFSVGDFTGDGKADIGAVWNQGATTYTLFAGGARVNVTNTSNAIDYTASDSTCHDPVSVAFVDFDKDGKAEWVVEDPGINLATGGTGCDATHEAGGGLRVIRGRNTAPLLRDMTGDEHVLWDRYYAPTTVPATTRDAWAELGVGCDVDNDGYGDLAVLPAYGGPGAVHGQVFYGSASGINAAYLMPLPDAANNSFDIMSMQPAQVGCMAAHKGAPVLVVSEGFSTPGALHLFAGRPLVSVGTIPSPEPGDSGFGKVLRSNPTDIDGDGKPDFVVGSTQFGWVLYGR
jgi:hypothetical protein